MTVSPGYKLYKTQVKTTFRVWCLYGYVVHGLDALRGPQYSVQTNEKKTVKKVKTLLQ